MRCFLEDPQVHQCCCVCKFHIADYFHCITLPIMRKSLEDKGKIQCICGIQKGWICFFPGGSRAHSNWPEHSVGCELFKEQEKISLGVGATKP